MAENIKNCYLNVPKCSTFAENKNEYLVNDVPKILGMSRKEFIDYILEVDGLFYFAQEIGDIKWNHYVCTLTQKT